MLCENLNEVSSVIPPVVDPFVPRAKKRGARGARYSHFRRFPPVHRWNLIHPNNWRQFSTRISGELQKGNARFRDSFLGAFDLTIRLEIPLSTPSIAVLSNFVTILKRRNFFDLWFFQIFSGPKAQSFFTSLYIFVFSIQYLFLREGGFQMFINLFVKKKI